MLSSLLPLLGFLALLQFSSPLVPVAHNHDDEELGAARGDIEDLAEHELVCHEVVRDGLLDLDERREARLIAAHPLDP